MATAGIAVSAGTLASVGFGAVWLQHYLENLRLKREVFRRVVGNVHGILYDCQEFQESHSFNEAGIIAINEVRAAFNEGAVHEAWFKWNNSRTIDDFVELIQAMSAGCKLKHYESMCKDQVGESFACSCIPEE